MKSLDGIKLVIDFDSTLTAVEGLDELANIALAGNADRTEIVAEIRRLTELGMTGKIGFSESLHRRVGLLQANRAHIAALIELLKTKITPSFSRNRQFLVDNRENICVLSGGFREFILPITDSLGLREENVFANTFVFDNADNIVGVDETNPLANDHGKIRVLEKLNLIGEIYVIGDGITDYELRKAGLATRFYAFVENVERPQVTAVADRVIESFDDFLLDQS